MASNCFSPAGTGAARRRRIGSEGRRSGCRVLIAGDDGATGEFLADVLAADGARVMVFPGCHAPVGDPDGRELEVAEVVGLMLATHGGLDALVLTAAAVPTLPLLETPLPVWRASIDDRLAMEFLFARAAAREFLRHGPRPAGVRAGGNILGVTALPSPAAVLGAERMLMRTLAQELAPHKVRVNRILLAARTDDTHRGTSAANPLLDRFAKAAAWLLSDAADFITGASLRIEAPRSPD